MLNNKHICACNDYRQIFLNKLVRKFSWLQEITGTTTEVSYLSLG